MCSFLILEIVYTNYFYWTLLYLEIESQNFIHFHCSEARISGKKTVCENSMKVSISSQKINFAVKYWFDLTYLAKKVKS